ncbi:Hypothetical protein, putative, partial [Bodo saltans]
MGQCACTDTNSGTGTPAVASPTVNAPNTSITSISRSSPPVSQRAFPKFDAAEGSKAIRNALDVAAGPPLVLQTAPRTARPPAPAQRIV